MVRDYLLITFLMFVGTWMLYTRKKRKYERTNKYGVERYKREEENTNG